MIDLHCHVLPGVDDGARDLSEALEMLRQTVADGTPIVCATPHAHGPRHHVEPAMAGSAWRALTVEARDRGIAVDLRLASEIWYRDDLPDLAREGRLVPLSKSGIRYALIEFPPDGVPPLAVRVYEELRTLGITPVIAHPERNPDVWDRPEIVERLRATGALAQVTAGSFLGFFRKESLDCARELLRRNAVDLIASDAHRRDRRAPGLAEAARVVAQWSSPETARRVTEDVPRAILAGEPVP